MAGFRDLNVLFCYHGHARFYDAPPISDRMTICGPFVTPGEAGGITRIKSGFRDFDLAELIEALKPENRPDIVFIRVDASRSVFPTGLERISAPVVILAGDTHHMATPLQSVIKYLQGAAYDYLITYNNRHHAHFYLDAGLGNVLWAPGPTVTPFAAPPAFDPAPGIVFVGGLGATHVRRRNSLNALTTSGAPLSIVKAYGDDAAAMYASHAGSLNCSLNGDLNMRVFEVLSAGGCLITDRLPKFSGLDLILTEGEHYLAYDSTEEMMEVCREVVADPDLARRIAANGKRAFDERLSLDHVMGKIAGLVFDGEVDDLMRLDDPRTGRTRPDAPVPLDARLEVYEALQEAGLRERGAAVYVDSGVPSDFIADLADLTQVSVSIDPERLLAAPDLADIFRAHRAEAVEPLRPGDAAGRDWGVVLTLADGLEQRILNGETPKAGLYLLCDAEAPALTFGSAFLDHLDAGTRAVRWMTPPVPPAPDEPAETAPPKRPAAIAPSALGLRDPTRARFSGAQLFEVVNSETYGHAVLLAEGAGFETGAHNIVFKIQRFGDSAILELRKADLSPDLAAEWGPEEPADDWGPYLRIIEGCSDEDAAAGRARLEAFGANLRAAASAALRLCPAIVDVALATRLKDKGALPDGAEGFRAPAARLSAFAAAKIVRG